MVPVIHRQAAEQLRRKLECLVAENFSATNFSASRCFSPVTGTMGSFGVFATFVVLGEILSADVRRGRYAALPYCDSRSENAERRPGPRFAVRTTLSSSFVSSFSASSTRSCRRRADRRPDRRLYEWIVAHPQVFVGRVDEVGSGDRAAIFLSSLASSPSIGL